MRSTLDVRVCHMLRVMRAVAPVEWNLGLPFPSSPMMADAERAIDVPENATFARWLENRAGNRQSGASGGIERPLAA